MLSVSKSKSEKFLYAIRFPFLLLAIIALLSGILSGLQRMGWSVPFPPKFVLLHGPLMISGFLGTLISLERAVALNKAWGYLAPLSAFSGIIALLIEPVSILSPLFMIFASVVLAFILNTFLKRHFQLHFVIMAVAPLFWLAGNVLWILFFPFSHISIWWAGFLVFTIAGERLELSRITRLTSGKRLSFIIISVAGFFGMALSLWNYAWGVKIFAVSLLGFCLWLLRNDLIRLTIRKQGLTKFVAIALLLGYLWLGAAGVIGILYGGAQSGPLYDAFLHAIFLGFTFSMIFGHAPIIFPAILKKSMAFYPLFYLHLAVLHLSLLLRVCSDLFYSASGRLWGGMLNGAAILLFFLSTIFSVLRSSMKVKRDA